MKLLLDANLSWRSAAVLKQCFDDCFHVDNVGLNVPAKDYEIWKYAKDHELVIVTNDEDFLNLLMLKGFPPKIVFLKTGNQSRKFIENLLQQTKEQILKFYQSAELGLLEIVKN